MDGDLTKILFHLSYWTYYVHITANYEQDSHDIYDFIYKLN